MGLECRFEAFDFPNHPNWNDPNSAISWSAFGAIISTRGNMRNLRFAMKYSF